MDELGGFEPTDTTGFIAIESIRIKKYVFLDPHTLHFLTDSPPSRRWAQANIRKGQAGVAPKDVYGSRV